MHFGHCLAGTLEVKYKPGVLQAARQHVSLKLGLGFRGLGFRGLGV